MNIKCYGWEQGSGGKIVAKFTTEFQLIPKIKDVILCSQECRVCLFDLGDINVNCPGVRKPDGDFRFVFTVREARRNGNKVICDLLPDERKCPDCLLKLRRKNEPLAQW